VGVRMADAFARHLRKNLTDAERRLWWRLRGEQLGGARFRKQAPIGKYVVDFVCFERKLIIELDGGQHAARVEKDEVRTAWLESQGFRVLRFWNHLIFEDIDPVLEAIGLALSTRPISFAGATPHPNPPPQGGRGTDKRD
jgi:very-short-patch-repair endonuclease